MGKVVPRTLDLTQDMRLPFLRGNEGKGEACLYRRIHRFRDPSQTSESLNFMCDHQYIFRGKRFGSF